MSHDLVINNARIVDGTGSPWFRGTVGVTDDRIDHVSRHSDGLSGGVEINADGAMVCPGFIDTHSHSDLELFADPILEPKTRQGITTEVIGQDGFSMAPIYSEGGAEEWRNHLSGLAGQVDREWTWESMAEYLDAVSETDVAPNVATLVGHGTVRYEVLGMSDRAPTDEELAEMGALVTEALKHGAIGFSTGLVYSPQVNADTDEVRALAERLAPFGRPFVAHIRSEGRRIWEALDEFVDIGANAAVPVHLSHYKVAGPTQFDTADRANALFEAARARGVDMTAEQYPYTKGSTMLSSLLPPWAHADGTDQLKAHLDDATMRDRMRRDIEEWRIDGWENVAGLVGWENITIASVTTDANEAIEGMTIADIAAQRGDDPFTAVCDLLLEEDLAVNILVDVAAEPDVREILTNERVGIATDGLFGGRPHPRTYGTYPRILGHYVRTENLLTLEMAVRKMTSLPARAMGFQTKGLLRPGMDADIVVFDPEIVDSRATYDQPAQYPIGIPHVIVNGEVVIRDGEPTGRRPGEVLREPV